MKVFFFLTCLVLTINACPHSCMCRSRGRVDCSKYNHSTIPNDLPTGTVSLDLHHNDIETIDLDFLTNCSGLKKLDLTNNLLVDTPQELFTLLPHLEQLNLRRNQLTKLPDNLMKGKKLTKLDVRGNRIESISIGEWTSVSGVKIVDLGRNNLQRLPYSGNASHDIFSIIEELDLSTNSIANLNGSPFSKMTSLRELKLMRNRLTSIDKSDLAGLKDVKTLDLSRNPISKLHSLMFSETPKLASLTLSRCIISTMDDGVFFGTEELKVLNLSHNQLRIFQDGWLYGLGKLEILDLSWNYLSMIDINVWMLIPSLKILNLANNRLRSLPSGAFHPLRQMESLNLAGNGLEALHKTAMAGLDQLASLDISSNRLSAIIEDSAILQGTLPNLIRLNFSNNTLKQIPSRAFQRFSSLTSLDLRYNDVTSISDGAFDPLKLNQLFINTSSLLCDCTISWFPPWLVSSGVSRSTISMLCAFPEPLAELDVIAIDTGNLTCGGTSPRPHLTIHPPENQTALVGGAVRFGCSARGASPLVVEWSIYEGGRARILEEDGTTQMELNSTLDDDLFTETLDSTLTFTGVTLDDRAEYQCVVRNQFGADYSNRSVLDVQQVPKLTSEPDDVSLLVGENARVECAGTGVPRPTIRWHKDGGDVFPAALEKRLHIRPGDDSIYIMMVKKEDAGVYTCVASNTAGSVQASATVRVYDNHFHYGETEVDVVTGATAVLDCTCDIQAGQRIEWSRDGERIVADVTPPPREVNRSETKLREEQPRRSLRANDQILIILETSPEDGGRYVCELMVGTEGLARRTIDLVVDGKRKNEEVDSGEKQESQQSNRYEALPYSMEFNRSISRGEITVLIVLFALLFIFVSSGIVWSLVSFRRTMINGC